MNTKLIPVESLMDRWVVISGIRDMATEALPLLHAALRELISLAPAGIVFGGAAGVDTGALHFVHKTCAGQDQRPQLLVIVPGTVDQQPATSARVIRNCADEVLELKRPLNVAASYHARNGQMLLEATTRSVDGNALLLAFPADDGRWGGTCATIARARTIGTPVCTVPIPCILGGKG